MSEPNPWPVIVDVYDDCGGVLILVGQEIQMRCGCTDALENDYGHREEA